MFRDIGCGQIDRNRIIAQTCVQGGNGTNLIGSIGLVPVVSAVDEDGIVAKSTPQGDTIGEVSGRIGLEGDGTWGQANDIDIGRWNQGIAGQCFSELVGNQYRLTGRADTDSRGLVAYHQFMTAVSGIQIERSEQVVQMPGQEVSIRIQIECSSG